ncbi:MAG: HIT family hydrolase [Phycisphaerae bacterium]|nr:HIT family hydrolase [Phycisphaerae bacterium]|tara:strand:- start:3928 stop:4455 length:528 start_codon:yes stop_codon:yes gene_type:complete
MQHENLWAPWRLAYLKRLDARRDAIPASESSDASSNFLADYWMTPDLDIQNHVILRDELGMILLNRYPYANGHLLIALGEPQPNLLGYDIEKRAAFWQLVETAMQLVMDVLKPNGANVGINLGDAAGAGLPEHVHAHVVPRWSGDTNFMTTIGDVRVMPASLEEMAEQYRKGLSG